MNKMLPLIGVGSAAALIGLVARRRAASSDAVSPGRQRPSGIVARPPDASPPSEELPAGPLSLPREFWDAAPESELYADDVAPGSLGPEREARYGDGDGFTADWLARATQAPALDDEAREDADDPAEIAADSLSMISDASRYAAAPLDDDDAASERS